MYRSRFRRQAGHGMACVPAARSRSIAVSASGSFPSTLREVDEMKRYCSIKLRAELRKENPDVLKACFLMSLEEEAEIFQMQAQAFEFLQVEGQSDAAGVYKIAQDRVREAWTMFVREARNDLEQDVDRGIIRHGARRISLRCTYSTDLLADDILGAFVHALDPAEPLSLPISGGDAPGRSAQSLAAHPDMPKLLQKHTAIFLHAASDVLFNRHGLEHWTGRDMPDAFLMHRILMSGRGAPIALAVLCQAVCRQAGVSLGIAVTDGGSQCVTWPQGESPTGRSCISVDGVPLVFDVASHGTISMEEEYKSYLEVNELVPSQGGELLFAVLSGLLECHWQQAFSRRSLWGRTSVVSCLRLALQPRKAPAQPYHLSQALVVAKRCMQLMPGHAETHLYYAALLFLSNQYALCLKHLDMVQQATGRPDGRATQAPSGAPPQQPPQPDREPASAAGAAGTRWLPVDDIVLQRRPARSGHRCTHAAPAGAAAAGGAAVVEAVPVPASAEPLELMPRPRRDEVARRQRGADSGPTGGAGVRGGSGGGGAAGRGDHSDGGADCPALTLDAPLPLDKSIFTPRVVADVQMLRQKAALMLQQW